MLITELEQTKALLAEAVKQVKELDIECKYCDHRWQPVPCAETDDFFTCEECSYDCYCKECRNNSKWQWSGIKQEIVL